MNRGRRDHGIRIVPVRRFPPPMSLGRGMAWSEQQRLMLVLIQGREHQSAIPEYKRGRCGGLPCLQQLEAGDCTELWQ